MIDMIRVILCLQAKSVVLLEYLSTDEAYDKAGGYAIQGTFGKYVESFEGSYDNVVGFPWKRIKYEIDNFIKTGGLINEKIYD